MKAKRRDVLAVLASAILWAPCPGVIAQNKAAQAGGRPAPVSPPKKAEAEPEYVPQIDGKPGGRVSGGGRRGGPAFVLSVLAPDHVALTCSDQPSMFWFISKPTSLPVEVTIIDPNADKPVLQTRVGSAIERGIHRVRLSDQNVRLAVDVTYQWSVAVIADADRRSRDILTSGMIERVTPEANLASRLAGSSTEDRVFAYARAGIWYDALEAVSDMIERSPADEAPRRYRAALLSQIGLSEVTD